MGKPGTASWFDARRVPRQKRQLIPGRNQKPLARSTQEFWERVAMALTVSGESMDSWAKACGLPRTAFSTYRRRSQRPHQEYLDKLCEITGCTMKFLDNPEPIDLSE
ncbi:hypothetical protein PhaeoP66_03226 [Phaeobacter inhibens]|uniref:HTH cro/C1-type domain-containing protein n=1 Tax=Phaeobacter inhibens TaxID=221822 RepID=A0ABN5GQU8_9RHOB|nr:hypothetical protein [Phaeobacter inhibens]AUQ95968.1 hypothetical protein PhaeoP66_03226 [Phaeobacter inhibens]